jgi:hypothetical protein
MLEGDSTIARRASGRYITMSSWRFTMKNPARPPVTPMAPLLKYG